MTADTRERSSVASHVAPGVLSALLQELAASPSATPSPPRLVAGARVGRFEVVRELGNGGFGVVYEARDRELGRAVALKLVQPVAGGVDARAASEAEAVARLSHPNLVTLYDVGRSEHGPYLVLELLRGETLERRIGRAPVSLEESVRIVTEVARGLAFAHAQGVFHRDLKPSNVFLTDSGAVKLLDFGMARVFGHRRLAGGTPPYMAPEQWHDDPEDERTDVFALGVMLHRMVSGELPFGPTGAGASGNVAAPPLDIPRAPALAELVSRMLQRVPRGRPRDAGAVLASLDAIAGELNGRSSARDGAAARPERTRAARGPDVFAPDPRRSAVARRTSRPALVAALVAAAAVVAGATWALWDGDGRHRPPGVASPSTPALAVLPFEDLSAAHDQEYLSAGLVEEMLDVLARVQGLRIIAQPAAFQFPRDATPADVARRLGATTLLDGSIRTDGERMRVTVRLVNPPDGAVLWSQTYDRKVGAVLSLQEDIARQVATALSLKWASDDAPAAVVPDAYTQYLLGVSISGPAQSVEDWRRALKAYERAVALDPGFAQAWARLATVYTSYFAAEAGETGIAQRQRAWEAAARALALAPDADFSHSARGQLRMAFDFDWAGARTDFEEAVRLNPAHRNSNLRLALLEASLGHVDEAIARYRRGVAEEPLSADRTQFLAFLLMVRGDFDGARAMARRALDIAPELVRAKKAVAHIALLDGRPQEARELAAAEKDERLRLYFTALSEQSLGRTESAGALVAEFERRFGAEYPGEAAQLYAWTGRVDEAFAALDREWESGRIRGNVVGRWRNDPLLRALHPDPRWKAFLARMKLPV